MPRPTFATGYFSCNSTYGQWGLACSRSPCQTRRSWSLPSISRPQGLPLVSGCLAKASRKLTSAEAPFRSPALLGPSDRQKHAQFSGRLQCSGTVKTHRKQRLTLRCIWRTSHSFMLETVEHITACGHTSWTARFEIYCFTEQFYLSFHKHNFDANLVCRSMIYKN